jgi:hypothetical protein
MDGQRNGSTELDSTIWESNDLLRKPQGRVKKKVSGGLHVLNSFAFSKDDYLRKKTCDQLTRVISIGTFQQRQVHPLGLLFMDTYFTRNNDGASRIDGDNDPNDVYDAPGDDKMDTKSDDLNEDSVHDNEARIDSNPPSLSS